MLFVCAPRCSPLARHAGAVARCNAAAHAGRVGAVHAKGWAVGFEIRPSCRMVLDTAYLGPLRYAGRVSGHKSNASLSLFSLFEYQFDFDFVHSQV